jgi:hypothetical protein
MKYKTLKELPFLSIGSIFGTGCWVGGGYGVDMGTTYYDGGGSSHNGVKCFDKVENDILEKLIGREDWIEFLPENKYDLIKLYEEGNISRDKFIDSIEIKPTKD